MKHISLILIAVVGLNNWLLDFRWRDGDLTDWRHGGLPTSNYTSSFATYPECAAAAKRMSARMLDHVPRGVGYRYDWHCAPF